jgi:hypothetical protein
MSAIRRLFRGRRIEEHGMTKKHFPDRGKLSPVKTSSARDSVRIETDLSEDELEEALNATFPASDPISGQSQLVPGCPPSVRDRTKKGEA